jgi:hypothetical protein
MLSFGFKGSNHFFSIIEFVLDALNVQLKLLLYLNVISDLCLVLLQLRFIKRLNLAVLPRIQLDRRTNTKQVFVAAVIFFEALVDIIG